MVPQSPRMASQMPETMPPNILRNARGTDKAVMNPVIAFILFSSYSKFIPSNEHKQ
jgi:hypothetical protein